MQWKWDKVPVCLIFIALEQKVTLFVFSSLKSKSAAGINSFRDIRCTWMMCCLVFPILKARKLERALSVTSSISTPGTQEVMAEFADDSMWTLRAMLHSFNQKQISIKSLSTIFNISIKLNHVLQCKKKHGDSPGYIMVWRTISVCLGENVPNYDFTKKLLLQFLSFFFL